MAAGGAGEPQRFRALTASARRDRDRSRVVVSILKAQSRVAQSLERALTQAGLTVPQFNILMELAAVEGAALPLYELNRRLINTPPNTSWLATKMQERALVTKAKDARDSRVVILTLTEAGWDAVERAAALVAAAERELLAGYSREELTTLARLLVPLTTPGHAAPTSGRSGV